VQKRILLMWSATGGGHRASAEAIKTGIYQLYGDKYVVDSVDMWSEHMEWPMNQAYKAYNVMVKHNWLWKCVFNAPEELHQMNMNLNAQVNSKKLGMAFESLNPDLVVSLHPAMQHVPLQVLEQRRRKGLLKRRPPFATVVTDLSEGCHYLWFHREVDRCFVPIEEVWDKAVRRGLQESQLRMFGLPVRPAFSGPLPGKQEMRQKLCLDSSARVAMLVGGGEGMGPVEATVKAIVKSGCKCQLVVICGKNKALADRIKQGTSSSTQPAVMVLGFVDNMEEWMTASDCIITKAGPGTIAEALICGLPILLNAFIPCQEEGNIPFVQNARVGDYKGTPEDVAATLCKWFSPEFSDELAAMSKRAREAGKPNALFDICHSLVELMESHSSSSSSSASA